MQSTLDKIKRILNNKPYPKFIGWDSFAELREKRKLSESFYSPEALLKLANGSEPCLDNIHLNPEEMGHTDPLNPEEEHAIHLFTSGSDISAAKNGISDLTGQPFTPEHFHHDPLVGSRNLNIILSGEFDRMRPEILSRLSNPQDVQKVIRHISLINNAIRQGRTNKTPVILYSGIPQKLGEEFFQNGKNSDYYLNRFTSTSTNKIIAETFAREYPREDRNQNYPYHIIQFQAEPNSAMSVAKHSYHYDENEAIIPPGMHIIYQSTDFTKPKNETFSPYYTHYFLTSPAKRLSTLHILNGIKLPSTIPPKRIKITPIHDT